MILLLALACHPDLPDDVAADGSLVLEQIRAPGPALGEAFLVIGPDGTSVLVDVGADAHGDEVREALRHHTGEEAVDWVVLTHHHVDHIAGFDTLFSPEVSVPVPIRRGVVVRGGPTGEGASGSSLEDVEAVLDDPAFGVPVFRLCDEADVCDGLLAGDLAMEGDEGAPSFLDLGEGARLELLLANGTVVTDSGLVDARDAGVSFDPETSDGENARSIGGAVTWGPFAYVFAGDLSGGGKDTPDVESFVAAHGERWPVDAEVLHLNHHGIQSSTNDAWVGRFLGVGVHHALVGSNPTFLDAPDEDVLDRLEPALGGGKVWAVGVGTLTGDHPVLDDREESVVVTVSDEGSAYAIQSRTEGAFHAGGTWTANP